MSESSLIAGIDAAQQLEAKFLNQKSNLEKLKEVMTAKEEEEFLRKRATEMQNRRPLNDSQIAENSNRQHLVEQSQQKSSSAPQQSRGGFFLRYTAPEPDDSSRLDAEDTDVVQRLLKYGANLRVKQDMKLKQAQEERESYKPEITKFAKSMQREESVEELLLKRKEEYNAHIEELRREKEREELSALRSPAINRVSKDMERSGPAYQRLYQSRREIDAKRDELAKQLKSDELKEVKGQPQINKVSKNMKRNIDTMMEWQKEKEEKRKEKKEQLEKEEQRSLKSPRINPISEKITKHMNRGNSVFQHLFSQSEKKRQEQEERRQRLEQEEAQKAVPLISPHSATLQRDETVYDRLYGIAREHVQSKQYYEESIQDRGVFDPSTGQQLHKPFINPRSSALVREEPVSEILFKKHKEQQEKLKQRQEQEKKEIKDKSAPKTNAYSQLLVRLMEQRTNTSSKDRLTQPIGQKIKPVTWESIERDEKEVSFRPRINEKSRTIDQRVGAEKSDRVDVLLKRGQEYEDKRRKLQEQRIDEELAECTFSPRGPVQAATTNGNASAMVPRTSTGPGDLADRNMEWVRRKEHRLELERQMKQDQELDGCTFQPNVYSPILQKQQPASPRENGNYARQTASSANRSVTPPPKGSFDNYLGGVVNFNAPLGSQGRSMTPPSNRELQAAAAKVGILSPKTMMAAAAAAGGFSPRSPSPTKSYRSSSMANLDPQMQNIVANIRQLEARELRSRHRQETMALANGKSTLEQLMNEYATEQEKAIAPSNNSGNGQQKDQTTPKSNGAYFTSNMRPASRGPSPQKKQRSQSPKKSGSTTMASSSVAAPAQQTTTLRSPLSSISPSLTKEAQDILSNILAKMRKSSNGTRNGPDGSS